MTTEKILTEIEQTGRPFLRDPAEKRSADEVRSLLKVPPQSIEAEQAVLGAMLSSKEAVSRALELLIPEAFYKEAHVKIFQAMIELFNKGDPIDVISLMHTLKKKKQLDNVGGTYYLTGLVEGVPTTANVDHYSKIVLEKWSLRRLVEIASEMSSNAFDEHQELDEILDSAEQKIFSISQHRLKGGFSQLTPVLHGTFEELDKIHKRPGSVTGVPSGLADLDTLTSGFQSGELIIIAGRPSMGKTALALTLARNAAVDYGIPVAIFSLEMSKNQLAKRLLCAEARVDSHLVRIGKLPKNDWQKLSYAVGGLAKAPIFIDDTPVMGVTELRAKSRRIKAEQDIQLLIVDYLQMILGPKNSESRQQEISFISMSLKALAKEINVPVLAVSQLSRAVESRSNHRPQLSDLRESGALEQDADLVVFLYREWIYSQREEDRGRAEVIVAKQRNGPTGSIEAIFIEQYAKFESRSRYEQGEIVTPF